MSEQASPSIDSGPPLAESNDKGEARGAEILVIAPTEMAAGFRLAGIAVLPANSPGEEAARVEEALEGGEARLVFFAERCLATLVPETHREVLDCNRPCFIPVPLQWQAAAAGRDDFENRLGRILGCHVNLAGQTHSAPRGTAKS